MVVKINENYLKLKSSYLFVEVARREAEFQKNNPDADVIKMGIGDVTKPLAPSVIKAFKGAVDEINKKIEKLYEGKGYGEFKSDLAEIVGKELKEIQTKYNDFVGSDKLNTILDKGRDRAIILGNKKIAKVYKKVGLGR